MKHLFKNYICINKLKSLCIKSKYSYIEIIPLIICFSAKLYGFVIQIFVSRVNSLINNTLCYPTY